MTATIQAFRHPAQRILRIGGSILIFWALGAITVAAADHAIGPLSQRWCTLVKVLLVVGVAAGCVRFSKAAATMDQALLIGVAWFVLNVIAEMTLARAGHGWYEFLGSPASPALRDTLIFTWLFAPALFARRE